MNNSLINEHIREHHRKLYTIGSGDASVLHKMPIVLLGDTSYANFFLRGLINYMLQAHPQLESFKTYSYGVHTARSECKYLNNTYTFSLIRLLDTNITEIREQFVDIQKSLEKHGWIYSRVYSSALTIEHKAMVKVFKHENGNILVYTNKMNTEFMYNLWAVMPIFYDIDDPLLKQIGSALYIQDYTEACKILDNYYITGYNKLIRSRIRAQLKDVVSNNRQSEINRLTNSVNVIKKDIIEKISDINIAETQLQKVLRDLYTYETSACETELDKFIRMLMNMDEIADINFHNDKYLYITVRTPLIYYDEDIYQNLMFNSNETKLNQMIPCYRRAFDNIFLNKTAELYMEATVCIILPEFTFTIVQDNFKEVAMPNPHLVGHGCVGGYAGSLTETAHKKDYIGFFMTFLTAAGSINFTDGTVLSYWVRQLENLEAYYCRVSCIKYKDQEYTWQEFKNKMNEEIADEKDKIKSETERQNQEATHSGDGETTEQ